jgi:hypothetical protein
MYLPNVGYVESEVAVKKKAIVLFIANVFQICGTIFCNRYSQAALKNFIFEFSYSHDTTAPLMKASIRGIVS